MALLCMLLEEPGNALDVLDPADMADLADELGCASAGDCAELLRDMASAGMLDAASLESGIVRAPVVDEAVDKWDAIIEAKRAAGRASGEARRKRVEERRSNDVGNDD